ncbi:MAG: DUF362 domain-containing protein [Chloroflexi bacterium]|nr:DUF362 domain-containing protein [Chloroflexota bacterium]
MRSHTNESDGTFLTMITRREFLRLAALAGLVAGCSPVLPTATPTSAPPPSPTFLPPTPTPVPTSPPAVTAAPGGLRRPDILKMFPAAPSQVVHTHHAGAWSGDQLDPRALRTMLDESITRLTGLSDAKQAWQALFLPTEQIVIKVNSFSNSVIWTHVPLVTAVTDSLLDAGIPAEQIVVYDFTTEELETAGFKVNKDGPGVRVYGTDRDYSDDVSLGELRTIKLSNILLKSDALINIPVLKSHMISGLTFALKNHFGTVSSPESLHLVDETLPALNALPQIKDRTRLVVGDVLEACLKHTSSWPYWKADYKGDSIMVSYDPIAVDTVGMKVFKDLKAAKGQDTAANESMSKGWFENAGKIGLGATADKDIQLTEVALK